MTRGRYVFHGPEELERVWRELAQAHGARTADEVLAHDLDLAPSSVTYRRRTGMWEGIDWRPAVRAHATGPGAAIVHDVDESAY